MRNIKVVAFDFDDTLVDEKRFLKKKWLIVTQYFSYLHKDLRKVFFKFYDNDDNKKKILDKVLLILKINSSYKNKIISKFKKLKGDDYQIKGSVKLINYLKRKNIKVGIMTNGKKYYQLPRIKKLTFYKRLDFIYFGDRHKKPSKEFFLQSKDFKKMNKSSDFLYVGDNYKLDILPALKLKMKAVLVGKRKNKFKNSFQSLSQLNEYLKKYE